MSDTSARRCRTPEPMEHECMLCRRADANTDMCGPKLSCEWICAHQFCLLFATDINPQGTDQEHETEFMPMDVQHAVCQAAKRVCFVCGKRGASITCQEMGCGRSFHLPCAVEGGCITRYLLPYSSFCWEHRPQQQELVAPENTNCIICLDPVEGRTTYGTLACPACKRAWFHRACMQGMAMGAGAFSFQCPLCQNTRLFVMEMILMGIRIPVRKASWEEGDEYGELYHRHSSCNARECLCPAGRDVAEPYGPWQLFLCSSCAAVGTHRRCSSLGNSREPRWECDNCTGRGTSSDAGSEPAGPSNDGPAASAQSPGSLELEFSSPSTSSPAASGQTLEPQAQETSSPGTSREVPSGPCLSCPVCEGSSRSSHPGPDQQQHQTQCARQTQTPYTWLRRLQERSRPPATRAASNTRSHAVPRLSRCSPSRETRSRSTTRQRPSAASRGSARVQRSRSNRAGGPMRGRDSSRVQRRAQAPYARPRRRSQRSRTPAAGAGRSPRRLAAPRLSQGSTARASHSRSTTRQRPSASSRGSRARQRGSTSRSTRPMQARDRSRSPLRAQTPTTRRRRCR